MQLVEVGHAHGLIVFIDFQAIRSQRDQLRLNAHEDDARVAGRDVPLLLLERLFVHHVTHRVLDEGDHLLNCCPRRIVPHPTTKRMALNFATHCLRRSLGGCNRICHRLCLHQHVCP